MTFYKVIKFPSYQKKKKKNSIFSQGQNNCREKVYLNLVVRNIPLIHHLKKRQCICTLCCIIYYISYVTCLNNLTN